MNKTPEESGTSTDSDVLQCGIVMPISAIDGCAADHWAEVKSIIVDAIDQIEKPKFKARLVSDADDVGVIQKRIVQGVYGSDVIVCDVSCKNPNVMFELGMRLAFDKPTVIIKDDKTDYTFDTGVIEHLTYPRDLRFQRVLDFKQLLAQKVLATYLASQKDPEHSTFLKNFGTFKVAKLEESEASGSQVILDVLDELQREVRILRRQSPTGMASVSSQGLFERGVITMDEIEQTVTHAENLLGFGSAESARELATMRNTLKKIREFPELPERLSIRLDKLIVALPPSPTYAKRLFPNGVKSAA